jgi:hypothetical protein
MLSLTSTLVRTSKASSWRPFILPTPIERLYAHVMMYCSADRPKSLFDIAAHLSIPVEWVYEAAEFWTRVGMLAEAPAHTWHPVPTDTQEVRAFHVAFPSRTKNTFWQNVVSFVAGLIYG